MFDEADIVAVLKQRGKPIEIKKAVGNHESNHPPYVFNVH